MINVLNSAEKPKTKSVRLVVDFPDPQTTQIFGLRWQTTAHLLGVRYSSIPLLYGENKIRLEIDFDGEEGKVQEFAKFIDDSLALATDIERWPNVN